MKYTAPVLVNLDVCQGCGESPCEGCDGTGIFDHCEVGGNYDHPWVERCDCCSKYVDDLNAAAAYAVQTGRRLRINPDFYEKPDVFGVPWVWVDDLEPNTAQA